MQQAQVLSPDDESGEGVLSVQDYGVDLQVRHHRVTGSFTQLEVRQQNPRRAEMQSSAVFWEMMLGLDSSNLSGKAFRLGNHEPILLSCGQF